MAYVCNCRPLQRSRRGTGRRRRMQRTWSQVRCALMPIGYEPMCLYPQTETRLALRIGKERG
jgi:hypothetical protein